MTRHRSLSYTRTTPTRPSDLHSGACSSARQILRLLVGGSRCRTKLVMTDLMGKDAAIEASILSQADARIEVARDRGPDAIIEAARDADGLLVNTGLVPRRVIESLERCQIIVRLRVGVDAVDVEAATARGILVCNVPDYCMDEVHSAFAPCLCACARNIMVQDRLIRRGRGGAPTRPATQCTRSPGATLGLAGFRKIPRQIVSKAQAFGRVRRLQSLHPGGGDGSVGSPKGELRGASGRGGLRQRPRSAHARHAPSIRRRGF